jgi:AcrR family transcriptional regulator
MAVLDEREVLRRGLDAFAELGYEQTSVRELARRLGVSHNFVNDRYGSKIAFWRAVVDYGVAEAGPLVPDVDADLDDVELLSTVVLRFYRLCAEHPQLHRLISDEAARDSVRLDHLVERFIRPTLAVVGPRVERLVAAGRLPPTPMHLLYFAVTSGVAGLIQTPLARRLGRPDALDPAQRQQLAEALARTVLDGALPLSATTARTRGLQSRS